MREIIQMMDVTSVPHVARYVRGVINLRGKVIPVIDLRTRLGLPAQPDTARTCIIVVEVAARAQPPRSPASWSMRSPTC